MRSLVLAALMVSLVGSVGVARANTPAPQHAASPPVEPNLNGGRVVLPANVVSHPDRAPRPACVRVSLLADGEPDYTREFVVAASSTAASVVGGVLGTLFGGPGLGSVGGAAVGAGLGGVAGGMVYDALTKKPKPKPAPPVKK